jgi:hypothetical protein
MDVSIAPTASTAEGGEPSDAGAAAGAPDDPTVEARNDGEEYYEDDGNGGYISYKPPPTTMSKVQAEEQLKLIEADPAKVRRHAQ